MKMTGLFLPLAFMLVVWIALKIYKANHAKAKGFLGEKLLQGYLRAHLDPKNYTIIHDIMLPLKDGTTTQIDHLVVCRWGVFVIEAKTYKGWIFGNAKEPSWTVTHGRRHYKFQNPLRQNYRHIATLSECLGCPESLFHTIVAFSGEAAFKTEMPPEVMHFGNVPDYIHDHSKVQQIPPERLEEVISAIREWDHSLTHEQRKNHVENLRKSHLQGKRKH